jgi:hypothetical protein
VKRWWSEVIHKRGPLGKTTASLVMLVSRELWKERHVWVFRNKASTTTMLTERIKEGAALWSFAGAKYADLLKQGFNSNHAYMENQRESCPMEHYGGESDYYYCYYVTRVVVLRATLTSA